MDITKIVTMLDYFIRKLNDMLNSLLSRFGASQLTSNEYELATKEILNDK